jgi:putative polyhydroxyalkanoate system protein
MPDIHIHRKHQLGLRKAREIAWQWAEEVEQKFDMECTVIEGEFSDTVSFKRIGVSGELVVADDHFALDAKLGFLLGAFSRTIESEIERNLDQLLAKEAAGAEGKARSAAKGKAKASPDAVKPAAPAAKPAGARAKRSG